MSEISNVKLNTFNEQYAITSQYTNLANSTQNTFNTNTIDNKTTKNSDAITIAGKEINKKKAIIGGFAILTAIVATVALTIKGKGKVSTPVPQTDNKVLNNITEKAAETAEEITRKAGDNIAAAANKSANSVKNTAEEIAEEITEKAGDTVEKAVEKTATSTANNITEKTGTDIGNKTVESAKETVDKIKRSGNLEERIANMDKYTHICDSKEIKAAMQSLKPETIEAMSDKTISGLFGGRYAISPEDININETQAKAMATRIREIEKHFTPEDIKRIEKHPYGEYGFQELINWIEDAKYNAESVDPDFMNTYYLTEALNAIAEIKK